MSRELQRALDADPPSPPKGDGPHPRLYVVPLGHSAEDVEGALVEEDGRVRATWMSSSMKWLTSDLLRAYARGAAVDVSDITSAHEVVVFEDVASIPEEVRKSWRAAGWNFRDQDAS